MKKIVFIVFTLAALSFSANLFADSIGDPPRIEIYSCKQECHDVHIKIYFPEGCEPSILSKFNIIRYDVNRGFYEYDLILEDHRFTKNESIDYRRFSFIDKEVPVGILPSYMLLDSNMIFKDYCEMEEPIEENPDSCPESNSDEDDYSDDEGCGGCSYHLKADSDFPSSVLILLMIGIAFYFFFLSRKSLKM